MARGGPGPASLPRATWGEAGPVTGAPRRGAAGERARSGGRGPRAARAQVAGVRRTQAAPLQPLTAGSAAAGGGAPKAAPSSAAVDAVWHM